jgi:hypothetical protein
MKKNLSNLLKKLEKPSSSKYDSEGIELLSNEEAVVIRGGDKEYKPIYEDEVKEYKINNVSILFNLGL